jgi:tetratricopeptide (TPR) repeat protein
LSGASQLLAEADSALALSFNPFNSDARVNVLAAGLNGAGRPDLAAAEASALQLISLAPGDARGYSLLGVLKEKRGDNAAAAELYEAALAYSRTEIHALLRLADARLRQGDMAGAVGFIDTIMRRWPNYREVLFPALTAVITTPDGREALSVLLEQLPPWRGSVLAHLAQNSGGLIFARDLLLAAPPATRASQQWSGEVNTVVTALAAAGAYGEAQMLFLSSLTAGQASLAGYVFDPAFTQPTGGGYFAWRVAENGAAQIDLPASGSGGLTLRFHDAPVPPGLIAQTLRLPAGSYRLEAELMGAALVLPRRLFWRLACQGGGEALAEVDVPEGSYPTTVVGVELDVPAITCPVQQLTLDTAVRTDSWRDRYRGEVQFSTLRIRRL